MGTHVVFFGPSTAGKTSLMIELSRAEGFEYEFTIGRTWTTRSRRQGEGDEENIFVSPDVFEALRPRFLFTFASYGNHKYAIEEPEPLSEHEIRMRMLRPTLAKQFRLLVPDPVIFCGISPFSVDPEGIMYRRDPKADPNEVAARARNFFAEEDEAHKAADIQFYNRLGLESAAADLGLLITDHLTELGM